MATLAQLEDKYFSTTPSGVSHSGDTEVIPHVDASSYFRAIGDAIDGCTAGDLIYIASWNLDAMLELKPPSEDISDLLVAKAAARVDVRVIVWTGRYFTGRGNGDRRTFSPAWFVNAGLEAGARGFIDIVTSNIRTVQALRLLPPGSTSPPMAGRALMDWSGAPGSRHQKYAVIYRKGPKDLRAFVGGIDLRSDARGAPGHMSGAWHDVGVELRGGAAASVWADFRTRWEETTSLPANQRYRLNGKVDVFNPVVDPTPVPSPASASGTTISSSSSVRVLRSYGPYKDLHVWGEGKSLPWNTLPADGVQEFRKVLVKAISSAATYIYVEDQGLNNEDLYTPHATLFPAIAAAANRGVKVIFVCPGVADPTDPFPATGQALSSTIRNNIIDELDISGRNNLVVYEVSKLYVHAKVVLVDDEFLSIGSANFWDRSMVGLDTELSVTAVDPGPLVRDLRVRLWADHLRVDPTDGTVATQLQDLGRALGIFRPEWGSGVAFSHPNSKLRAIPE